MVRRDFAWTNVKVPVIGHGTWMMEGDRETERAAIEASMWGSIARCCPHP
jgi:diketogulonate reductase-like aldo/keto reductase